MTCQGWKVKTRQDHDFFHTTMWQIQKFEKFFFVVAFSSVVSSEKKIMSIAEEEREGELDPMSLRWSSMSIFHCLGRTKA